jgi:hypothetical protein
MDSSSVGIATGYGLDDRGSLLLSFQTGSGTDSWVRGAEGQGCDTDHSPPYGAEVQNAWKYASTPPYVIMSW